MRIAGAQVRDEPHQWQTLQLPESPAELSMSSAVLGKNFDSIHRSASKVM